MEISRDFLSSVLFLMRVFVVVQSKQSFILQLNEEVNVIKHVPTVECFNKTISNDANTSGTEKFVFSRGVLSSIHYETVSPVASGTTRISLKAEFQCCSFYCAKFGRLLKTGTWISGNMNIDIIDESTVGIYYNKVQVCHSSYLKGIFGQSVTFSPFTLEGNENECLITRKAKSFIAYVGVGMALRVSSAEVGTNSIVVYFGFSVTNWSKNFLLKLMREGEHGTLTNVNAVIYVKQAELKDIRFGRTGTYFGAVALFGMFVIVLAILLLICTRSKRAFLEQTWKTYDAYLELHNKENGHTNNVELGSVS